MLSKEVKEKLKENGLWDFQISCDEVALKFIEMQKDN